ncbi:MAG: DsbA family protein [Steroidobacteraceae bacterium]
MSGAVSFPVIPVGSLDIDLVGDFSCPWSFLGTRRLARALGHLQGVSVRELRWHALRLKRPEAKAALDWREHLAARLPKGVSVEFAESSLAEAGEALGIHFDFSKLAGMPDTTSAHRLVKLAAAEGLHGPVLDAIFRAYFEQGRDIGDVGELAKIGAACGVSAGLLETFRDPQAGYADVIEDERRLLLLGVNTIPNLLFNRHVLVPGPADEQIYVKALDQALFPGVEAGTRH